MKKEMKWERVGDLAAGEAEALEAVIGGAASQDAYETKMGMAAAMHRAGFSLDGIRTYFAEPQLEIRQMLLGSKRSEIVEELHKQQRRLSQVDYLLWMEGKT